MRKVLTEDGFYPYLKENAAHRLDVARHLAANTGLGTRTLIHLGGQTWCLFPWLGTRSFRTLRRVLAHHAASLGISGIEFEGCCYIKFHLVGDGDTFVRRLAEIAEEGLSAELLVGPAEHPLFDKFDPLLPAELLRRAYAQDRLYLPEVEEFIRDLSAEWQ